MKFRSIQHMQEVARDVHNCHPERTFIIDWINSNGLTIRGEWREEEFLEMISAGDQARSEAEAGLEE